jgi:diadenosine tetraphosphate (Ap4A) HIT family hydrolase
MEKTCPFCVPEPSRLLVAEGLVLALRDGYPVSRGHSLIVPRRHVGSFGEASLDEQSAMLAMLQRVRAMLDEELRPDGYNIGINDGTAAGQTVMHVHMHVIPRYRGDRPDPRGGIRWIIPEKADYWSDRGLTQAVVDATM